jgi:hypothetical protein
LCPALFPPNRHQVIATKVIFVVDIGGRVAMGSMMEAIGAAFGAGPRRFFFLKKRRRVSFILGFDGKERTRQILLLKLFRCN